MLFLLNRNITISCLLADELLAPLSEGSNVAFGNLPRGYKALALSPHFHSALFRPLFGHLLDVVTTHLQAGPSLDAESSMASTGFSFLGPQYLIKMAFSEVFPKEGLSWVEMGGRGMVRGSYQCLKQKSKKKKKVAKLYLGCSGYRQHLLSLYPTPPYLGP